ncbi:MBL fold metallo-hydrolase [Mycobacterium sp. IS-1590]|uniref:MBL fold metallo-hydrolase n=1 Tax=Mycobacterium sp. IS-1590 TaxID=1772286 RepID=UPI00074955EE|nr:MBL fold metallo-hydrolase [Mycobacterium sp. IS-1590]KUI41135.1 MBL fold metallo-hydrolase [Mycobacterium sp. IS-1590]
MDVTVTFIGNATTLISGGGITLLTDPNFLHRGQHAYLGYGLVSRRRKAPALDVDQLPALDAVVLSHMHGDHWDRVAQSRLDHGLPILTTPHAAKRLAHRGFGRALAIDTWKDHTITKGAVSVTVTSLPGRHAPTPVDRFLPPVMGSMIEFSDGAARRRLYVSGDTLFVDELREIPVRFESIDLGMLHLGGTRLPFGRHLPFGLTVTMDGQQGADVVELLHLPKMIPVHFDDYGVFASPLSDFVDEMKRRGLSDRIIELERGSSVTV